jgi:thiamine kinase-like enzyme
MSRIHSWFHQQKGVTENLALNHPERMLRDARRLLNDRKTTMTTERPQSQAIIAAKRWIWSSEPQELVESSVLVFCRGDTNVTNYLWQGVRVSVVDFEKSGLNDPVFEVADYIEHPLRHDLPGWAGTLLASAACLDRRSRKSLEVGRRLAACYWLAVLLRLRGTDTEQRLGVSIARQADRVAERLNVQ